jgi:hypothetical protein
MKAMNSPSAGGICPVSTRFNVEWGSRVRPSWSLPARCSSRCSGGYPPSIRMKIMDSTNWTGEVTLLGCSFVAPRRIFSAFAALQSLVRSRPW